MYDEGFDGDREVERDGHGGREAGEYY